MVLFEQMSGEMRAPVRELRDLSLAFLIKMATVTTAYAELSLTEMCKEYFEHT